MKHTPCSTSGLDFSPDKPPRGYVAKLKAVCATCPIQTQCLDFAIENKEPLGVWGGMTIVERRKAAYERTLK